MPAGRISLSLELARRGGDGDSSKIVSMRLVWAPDALRVPLVRRESNRVEWSVSSSSTRAALWSEPMNVDVCSEAEADTIDCLTAA
jgi:hypothetical protein